MPDWSPDQLRSLLRMASNVELEGCDFNLKVDDWVIELKINRLVFQFTESSEGDASVEAARSLKQTGMIDERVQRRRADV
jgi:hypothetical protein